MSAPEHIGTHMDAPAHFTKGKWHINDIPLVNLIGPAVVIDISSRASIDSDTQLDLEDIINWENKYGRITDGAIVFMYSGWGAKWPNKVDFFGSSTYNDTTTLHFPGFHPDAINWLVNNRTIVGFGVDTASLDYGQSTQFMAHRLGLSANVYGLENVANLNLLQPVGATVVAMPMKIKSGSGAPCRIIAMLTDSMSSSGSVVFTCTADRGLLLLLIVLVPTLYSALLDVKVSLELIY